MNKFAPLFPFLIPSFSSKGNLLIHTTQGKYVSDNYDLLLALDIRVSRTYLVSAYDVYYGFMPQDPLEWPQTEYLFIDSGGYETNDAFELNERNKYNYKVLPWDAEKMETVYQKVITCPKFNNASIILTGFDNTGPFCEQLKAVQLLKSKFPNATIIFLIKLTFPIEDLTKNIAEEHLPLNDIPIIGITEKELGNTVKERLLNLISIKRCLLDCGWTGCIHIFGGLEPSLTKLYYFAGADIFDGLSWQRIRFQNNSSLFEASEYIVTQTEYENRFWMMIDNLAFLQNLCNDMSTMNGERNKNIEKLKTGLLSDEISIQSLLTLLEE